jgi:NAD(P)-dependent dehydrogenase (short-subunit alcohol dehydrogenase family)
VPPHFPDASPAQWGATLDLSLRGAMLATQLVLEPMRRAGGGAVLNVASTAGPGLAAYVSPEYGAAKAGLIRFTATVAAAVVRFVEDDGLAGRVVVLRGGAEPALLDAEQA